MRIEALLCSCCETVIGLVLLDVATCESCGDELPDDLDEGEAVEVSKSVARDLLSAAAGDSSC